MRGDEHRVRRRRPAAEGPRLRGAGHPPRVAADHQRARARASDIHIEPFENRLIVRYRIDGVLHEVESPPRRLSAAVISRVKIMAKLDIAERRLPQDGRIQLRVQGKEIDLRVSTVPTMHGESVVMRILDKGGVALDFAKLGFERGHARALHASAAAPPHGILLVTGPTGTGKTTTLYTALDRAQQARREDPHRRGPGRVPDARHQPDPGQAADRPDVRQRAALDRAPGPRRDHDRRDPRPRDRADRGAVGADRPPGALDAAHQRRAVDGQPPARHGRRGLPAHVDDRRHPGAAPGAHALRAVQGAVHGAARSGRADRPAPLRAGRAGDALHAGGLRGTARTPATSGRICDHRDDADDRRDPHAGDAARDLRRAQGAGDDARAC